jgi:hypothetical protein
LLKEAGAPQKYTGISISLSRFFVDYLTSAGFHVTVIDESSFDEKVRPYALPPSSRYSSHPLATNHRKIYFARRPVA